MRLLLILLILFSLGMGNIAFAQPPNLPQPWPLVPNIASLNRNCLVGNVAYVIGTTAGSNLYLCTRSATNSQPGVWTPITIGGPATSGTSVRQVQSNMTKLNISGTFPNYIGNCSPVPCTQLVDNQVFYVPGCTMTSDGTTPITLNIDGLGTVRVFAADAGADTGSPPSALALGNSGGCGNGGFEGAIPIAYRNAANILAANGGIPAFAVLTAFDYTTHAGIYNVVFIHCTDSSFTTCFNYITNSNSVGYIPVYTHTNPATLGSSEGNGINFAALNALTPTAGAMVYCTDCKVTTVMTNVVSDATCTNGGAGALAIRVGSTWKCTYLP